MALPEMDESSRNRPLSFCPTCNRYIYYDDIVSGTSAIVPLETLSEADLRKLVIKRYEALPKDMKVGPMAQLYSPDEVIRMIEQDEPFGKMTVQAETSYLRSLLDQLAHELEQTAE